MPVLWVTGPKINQPFKRFLNNRGFDSKKGGFGESASPMVDANFMKSEISQRGQFPAMTKIVPSRFFSRWSLSPHTFRLRGIATKI